jgi:hypothetical protein
VRAHDNSKKRRMKANTLRQQTLTGASVSERPYGWDAFKVWSEHVRNAPVAAAEPTPSPGWDPYLVWLTRVKKS